MPQKNAVRSRLSKMSTNQRKFFVGGNWKMNGTHQSIDAIVQFLTAGPLSQDVGKDSSECEGAEVDHLVFYLCKEVVVAPPSLYVAYVRERLPASIGVAGQNCYKAEKGAFTGEIRYSRPSRTRSTLVD